MKQLTKRRMLIFTAVFFVNCIVDLCKYIAASSVWLAKAFCIVIPNFMPVTVCHFSSV